MALSARSTSERKDSLVCSESNLERSAVSSVGLSRSAIFCSAARIARAEAIAREPVWGTGRERRRRFLVVGGRESGRGEAREQSREAPLCCALLVASTQNEMTSFGSSGVNTKPAPLFAHRVSLGMYAKAL